MNNNTDGVIAFAGIGGIFLKKNIIADRFQSNRVLAHKKELQEARAIVVAAGMEGALASVVGGMVDVPVIAVPTSIGYGASFGGIAALLAMLNSCVPGVVVVNIDNGFGAGYAAAMINRK